MGCQHWNLYQSLMNMSKVTHFTQRDHTWTCVCTPNARKIRERIWRNEIECTGKVEVGKKENYGSGFNRNDCNWPNTGFKGRTLTVQVWFLSRGDLNFLHLQYPSEKRNWIFFLFFYGGLHRSVLAYSKGSDLFFTLSFHPEITLLDLQN